MANRRTLTRSSSHSVLLHTGHSSTILLETFDPPYRPGISSWVVKRIKHPCDISLCLNELSIIQTVEKSFPGCPKLFNYELDQRENCLTITMEYCSRRDMRTAIAPGNDVCSVYLGLKLARELTKIVCDLHRLNIFHGNIKLENVLLTDDWGVRLTDFDLAGVKEYKTIRDMHSKSYRRPFEFQQDVFDLGLTLLQFLSRDSNLEIVPGRLRDDHVATIVETHLQDYPLFIRSTIKAMLQSEENQRVSAADALELFVSGDAHASVRSMLGVEIDPTAVVSQRSDRQSLRTDNGRIDEIVPEVPSILLPDPQSHSQPDFLHRNEYDSALANLHAAMSLPEFNLTSIQAETNAIIDLLTQFPGKVNASLSYILSPCHLCNSETPIHEVTLLCGHIFCRSCINAIISKNILFENLLALKCPICSTPLDPFSDSIFHLLQSTIQERLDKIKVAEMLLICPKCKYATEKVQSLEPVSVKCIKCKYKFCSFCRESAHYSSCQKYNEDKKKAR